MQFTKDFMKYGLMLLAVGMGISGSLPARAQTGQPERLPVLVPESAGYGPRDRDVRFHTHLRVLVAADATSATVAQFNTPATIRSAYALPSTGGSGAIAIVDAYHDPTALADFNAFAQYFQLPRESSATVTAGTNPVFQLVYATGKQPLSGGNYIASWNLEEALDIEWAHAIAPNAKIYLVEAASDSASDLYYAVKIASSLPGVKEISMSWGGSESANEVNFYDPYFTSYGIVYLAAGGDTSDEVGYPSASPNVISCGGTSVNRSASGAFISETGWSDTGCGSSAYEARPAYQSAISKIVGAHRGVNDVSFVADPNTGVYVYDSTKLWGESGWWILGGTSLSTPSLAGVLNQAASSGNGFALNTASEQIRLYGSLGNALVFRDITSGTDGKVKCAVGWDFVTGVGSPVGLSGK
jgi:subtilase family serine protease